MRKVAEIIGLPVINLATGEIIGEVDDLIFIPVSEEIKGLIIKNKNKYFVRVDNIYAIGEDAITISDKGVLIEVDDLPGMGVKDGNNSIIGEKVVTSSGKEVGLINDLIIDENDRKIIGYELSEGLVQDIFQGRNILPVDKNITYGKDTLIVADEEGV